MTENYAFLKALTPEAKACLGQHMLPISHYPFRVGGDSRHSSSTELPERRRNGNSIPNNDLYLLERGPLLNVSREHFQIEIRAGEYYLVDRGSACGTLVEGTVIGKNRIGGERRLEDGDVIIVGTSASPYAFKFINAA
jgi:hypothetical protein